MARLSEHVSIAYPERKSRDTYLPHSVYSLYFMAKALHPSTRQLNTTKEHLILLLFRLFLSLIIPINESISTRRPGSPDTRNRLVNLFCPVCPMGVLGPCERAHTRTDVDQLPATAEPIRIEWLLITGSAATVVSRLSSPCSFLEQPQPLMAHSCYDR